MVWFELVYFGLVWFLMLQSVSEVLVSIHTKFEFSMCLVCPTIKINICSIPLIKKRLVDPNFGAN